MALRALEQEVLDEVRDAGLAAVLVPRAGSDPVADRGRADVLEPLRDDPLPRVELAQDPVLHARIVVPVYRRYTTCRRGSKSSAGSISDSDSSAATPRPAQTPPSSAVSVGDGTRGDRREHGDPDRAREHGGERLLPARSESYVGRSRKRVNLPVCEARPRVGEREEHDPEHTDDERDQGGRRRRPGEAGDDQPEGAQHEPDGRDQDRAHP